MKAVIMAGGQGTRLRPLTSSIPKPMLPVVNKPIMEHIINLVAGHDITDLYATLQFLPTNISNYFNDGSDWNVSLTYALEKSPLGTAGSVKNCSGYLDEPFLVISGDALTDIDITRAVDFHHDKKAMVTLVLVRVANPLEFGIVVTGEDGRIERFLEKPNWGQVFSDTINTGIYVLDPAIFEHIPGDGPFDFSQDLFPLLLQEGYPLYGYIADGYWCDVGNFAQYLTAQKDVLDGKVDITPPGFQVSRGVWLGEEAEIAEGARVVGPVVIGAHSKVESGATIREYSVIGSNVAVKDSAFVHRSILFDNTYVGNGSHLRGCVIGKNCDLKSNVRVEEGVVIGDDCLVGENVLINHDVKIYPFKTIEAGATVNTSIIWESKGMRTLFGNGIVSGITNVDITPEHALRIAMAYGSILPRNSQVVTSRDASRQARTIKRAIITGLNATGVNVSDLEISPIPVNRFIIKTQQAAGGIDVRTNPHEPQSIDIQFMDGEGIDLSEGLQRSIEKVFSQANFRRAFGQEIGAIRFPHRAIETYTKSLLEQVEGDRVRQGAFKIVVDCAFGGTGPLLPSILGSLGCDILSLNAYVDEHKASLGFESLSHNIQQVSRLVKDSGADLGAVIDSSGERVFLIDDKGRHVDLNSALLLFVHLVSAKYRGSNIAVPVSITSGVEAVAGKSGNSVVRTKVSRNALMDAALKQDLVFAGAGAGGYIFPDFLPAYDGMISLVKLLELLTYTGQPMSANLAALPAFNYLAREFSTSWENVGLIMRRMREWSADKRVDLTDGLKVFLDDTDWVLVLPDAEEPVLHIIADSDDAARCENMVEEYLGLIRGFVT
jgi:mannose-1-phosphate guanylyltransferase / phosphomannomutase